MCDSEDVEDFSNEEAYDSVGSSTASSGCETECQNEKHSNILHVKSPSLALDTLGSDVQRRSPILMLAVINDGNTTDDSGIDSINCDSAMSPAGMYSDCVNILYAYCMFLSISSNTYC